MQWSFTPSCIYIPPSLSPLPCTQRHCRLHIYERPSLCINATQNHYHAGLALRSLLPQTHAWIRQIFISPPLSFAGGGVSKRVRPLPPASFTTASQLVAGHCCKPQSREQSQNPGPSPLPSPSHLSARGRGGEGGLFRRSRHRSHGVDPLFSSSPTFQGSSSAQRIVRRAYVFF